MPDFIISLSTAEVRILKAWGTDIQAWIESSIRNKVRRRADEIIRIKTPYNPSKLTIVEKIAILKDITFKDGEFNTTNII